MPSREQAVQDLEQDWGTASKYLGKGKHYADFLRYFQVEMEKTSWQHVLQEYVCKGDERSNDLFARLYAGTRISPNRVQFPG